MGEAQRTAEHRRVKRGGSAAGRLSPGPRCRPGEQLRLSPGRKAEAGQWQLH